nr:hypothetical protein [uncultured Campylobacter sp.]
MLLALLLRQKPEALDHIQKHIGSANFIVQQIVVLIPQSLGALRHGP